MDEQRMEAYGNLIQSMLSSPPEDRMKILDANHHLLDPVLVKLMKLLATEMAESGEIKVADWLQSLATGLEEIIAGWEQQYDQALHFYQNGEYAQGIIVGEQALELALQLWAEEYPNPNVANSMNNLAQLYQAQGRLSEAEPLFVKALAAKRHFFGEEHFDVATSLDNLAILYRDQGKFNAAETLSAEALAMRKRLFSEEHLVVALSLNNLAAMYNIQGKLSEAEPLFLEALEMRKRLLGEEHLDVAQSLNNLAVLYQDQGRFSEAENLLLKALAMKRRLLGEVHPDIANSLNNLAGVYKSKGNFSEAEKLFSQALEMRKRIFGEEHPAVATSLNNLALIHENQGRFSEAEQLYVQSLEMTKRLLGEEHPDVAISLNNLGLLYEAQGRFSDAEQLLVKALAMRKQFLREENLDIAVSLNNLALIYQNQGRFSKAEKLYVEALEMTKRHLGEEHPNFAIHLRNLKGVYISQGRWSEAETLMLKALSITKSLLGEEHPHVAGSFNDLAELYKYQKRFSEAESLYLEALGMAKRLLGEEHPDIATMLSNLAGLYHDQKQFCEAEQLCLKVLEITKRLLGGEHPDVATRLYNLAVIYNCQGRFNESESLHLDAWAIRKRLLREDHPAVIDSLNNLAVVMTATNRYTEAHALMRQATEIENGVICEMFAASSDSDRLAYLQTIRKNFDVFLSLVNSHLSNSPEAKQEAYDLVLKRKALTAAAFAAFNYALYSDRYSHLAPQFKQWQSLRAEQIHLIYSPPLPDPEITDDEFRTRQAEYQKRLSDLETECKKLEKLLASQVPEIQLQQELETANRRAVALELPEGSTLVEFVRFDVCDFQAVPARGESKWKPARYLAFILPAKQPDKVEMIDLGEAEHIDKLLRVFRAYFSGQCDLLDMGDDDEETPTFMKYNPASGMELRQAVFDPIAAVIGDSKYLLISPDGELNLLPFQLLPDKTGTGFLMDEYTISYLSVGRDILRSHFQPNRPAIAPLIIADPDFDLGGASETRFLGETGFLSVLGNTLERAPGTRFLGEAVAKKLQVSPYFDAEALETQITKSPSPSILLMATHGVFLPDLPHQPPSLESRVFGNRFSATKVENPMLRSGLALAGANIWLSGGTLPEKAGKGFLFAQDVAALDLWANELTVLSACNTAMGDVKIGEGVFGLRRAFAVAGTKTLVMSLWPVPDKATALLMERFFDNLERGLGRSNALLDSQNYIRNITVRELRQSELGREVLEELLSQNKVSCQEEERPLEHPFYWGAWVCQGETNELK